jgi:hypothetical protein
MYIQQCKGKVRMQFEGDFKQTTMLTAQLLENRAAADGRLLEC